MDNAVIERSNEWFSEREGMKEFHTAIMVRILEDFIGLIYISTILILLMLMAFILMAFIHSESTSKSYMIKRQDASMEHVSCKQFFQCTLLHHTALRYTTPHYIRRYCKRYCIKYSQISIGLAQVQSCYRRGKH